MKSRPSKDMMKGEIRFIRGRPKFFGAEHGLPQPLAIVELSRAGANPKT
jgi:hypothetical protein